MTAIIGYTSSSKPMYDHREHPNHAGFTPGEYQELDTRLRNLDWLREQGKDPAATPAGASWGGGDVDAKINTRR